MPIKQDPSEYIGKKFGRLLVLEDLGCPRKVRRVKAQCECGVIKDYSLPHLKRSAIVSCGCNKREYTINRNTKHGLRHHPLNKIWQGMKGRCNYTKNIGFKHYGGRGIKICAEWNNSLSAFYEWSIQNGYKAGLQIDRIDNDGDYEPRNCRWITPTQNNRNTRNNRLFTINGVTKCLSEWADNHGIASNIIMDRVNKLGWSIEKALQTPKRNIKHAHRL